MIAMIKLDSNGRSPNFVPLRSKSARRSGVSVAPCNRICVCIAKTHLSISSDAALKGAPTGWRLPVREVRASAGAGFVYPLCGEMRTMPGLGTNPAAARIDLDENSDIVGLS